MLEGSRNKFEDKRKLILVCLKTTGTVKKGMRLS